MKYMGSKRSLLSNGLGEELIQRSESASRFVDLFAGSASVAWFVARHSRIQVVANDLQHYSAALADAVLCRTRPANPERLLRDWLLIVDERRRSSSLWRGARELVRAPLDAQTIAASRELCLTPSAVGPCWNAYGGYYFSPDQALTLDFMIEALPSRRSDRALCLAAALSAATRCAASPGHTAQPLSPSVRGLPFIASAWARDPIDVAEVALRRISTYFSQQRGRTVVGDALDLARRLRPSDVAFVDPPYSNAQYSRFYHVLETLARGTCGPVSGSGRYPPISERPQSEFSLRSRSLGAMGELISALAASGSGVVLTFPQYLGSNGLESEAIVAIAREYFSVDVRRVSTEFSTLGGNGRTRSSRRRAGELVLSMHQK